MEAYETMKTRKTIRDFSDKPVTRELIERIISAAFLAPSNNHMREWHFILLDDRVKREEILLETIKPISAKGALGIINRWQLKDTSQRAMYLDAIPKQISMLRDCACLILPCFRQYSPLLKPKTLSDLNNLASIWLAIENILLAAAAEGVFGVTRIPGETERARLKEYCHIPDGYEMPCLLALGYPAEGAKRAGQVEINLPERIHQNIWYQDSTSSNQ
jgi:nitroreductase